MKFKLILIVILGILFCAQAKLHAICDISSSFTALQVLTAAQLNTLVTDSESCSNNVLNGDDFTGTMRFLSGVDAAGYSDTGSTLTWLIDAASGDATISLRDVGTVSNCEINYASGTITISGRGAAALSATNPCHVGIRSNSNGVVVRATFTANITATDGSASQTDGNLFGITDANWANAMPIFFGVVYDGTTPYFTLARKPIVLTGSAATDVCQLTDTSCDGENDVMILTTGLTLASWVSLPITQVAWLQGTYATTGAAWTFAESAYTGFNDLYETQTWTMPAGQNGAAASGFMLDNGGTAVQFTTDLMSYTLSSDGFYNVSFFMDADAGQDGSGAVEARFSMPATAINNSSLSYYGIGYLETATPTTNHVMLEVQPNTSYATILNEGTTGRVQLAAGFPNGARTLKGSIIFKTSLN